MKTNSAQPIIEHNTQLPIILKSQHKNIMLKFKNTLEYAETRQYTLLQKSLSEFSYLLTEHFRSERELYMYLELVVSGSDGSYRNTRNEMKDIAVAIFSIINLHTNTTVNDHTIDQFKKDFALLGKELLGRMRHEEKYLFDDYSRHGA